MSIDQIKKGALSVKLLVPAAVLAISGLAVGVTAANADTGNYKQAFTASGSSISGVFDVAGDESSITYYLNGATSGSLECQSNGNYIDVADLSGSGTINSSSISAAAMNCNPAINTVAHVVQDMREGKIALVSGGTQVWLQSGAISNVPPAVSGGSTSTTTPTTGTGTSTTTPSTGSGTSSTTPTTGTSTSPTVGTTTDPLFGGQTVSASALTVALNNIFIGHVSTSLDVLHAISRLPANATTSPEVAATLTEQDQNAVDLSNAIGSVYGSAANTAFLALFRAHITDSNAYTLNYRNGNTAGQAAALADLDVQLQKIAAFLAAANPNIGYDGALAALRQHEQLVNTASTDYANGDYADAFTVQQQAINQISGAGTGIAAAIVAQYPGSFTQ